jgi:hypothetical protein
MLPPGTRCVRSKMALFLRLWVTRHRYEQLRPFGRSGGDALRFHLRQLQALWSRVIACQKALGLEVASFHPREHFEAIYVVSGYAQREIESRSNTAIDAGGRWGEYLQHLRSLNHDINPFEFSDICAKCERSIDQLTGNLHEETGTNIIPMERTPFEMMRLGRAALF